MKMRNKKLLQKELKDMIKDEKSAPMYYKRIKNKLSTQRDKRIVDGIIRQERQHFRKVKKIIRRELK